MRNKILFIIVIAITNFLFGNQQYIRLKTGIHFDSQVSGGKYSLEELAHIIGKSDLDVAIITDHDNMEVRYGLPFFHKAFQIPVRRNSIASYGFDNYFNKINTLNKFFPDVEIIPGIEAVPYYHWEGNPIFSELSLRNWHRHLLVFGMDEIDDYKELPSLKTGFPRQTSIIEMITSNFHYYSVLFTILLVVFTLIFLSLKNHKVSRYSIIIWVIATYIFTVEFPYSSNSINQYNPQKSTLAYQNLINYVSQKNGLIYWAHPEAEYEQEFQIPIIKQSMLMKTDKYSHLVYETKNHSGFAGFWEGMKVLGKPEGLWDIALQEYCAGLRKMPQFIIGELDFEETNDLKLINETNTFIFAANKTHEAIFEAMRKGRMYTTRNFLGDKLVIDEFRVYNLENESSAFIGETLQVTNNPIAINIKITATQNISNQVFTLYRNKIPIKQLIINGSLDEWIVDENYPKTGKFYYKLYGGDDWINLVTNPIFVENR